MTDILADLQKAYRLNGDTYSSAEIIGMVGRGVAEIARLRADNERLRAALQSIADQEPATADVTLAHMMAQEAHVALSEVEQSAPSKEG